MSDKVQAVPQDLFSYSDKAVPLGDKLKTFLDTVQQWVDAYNGSSLPPEFKVSGIDVGNPARPVLAGMRSHDHSVRYTGQAFIDADQGHQRALNPGLIAEDYYTDPNGLVMVTGPDPDKQLDKATITQALNDAKDFKIPGYDGLGQFNGGFGTLPEAVFQHLDDPVYAKVFLQSIGDEGVKWMLVHYFTDQPGYRNGTWFQRIDNADDIRPQILAFMSSGVSTMSPEEARKFMENVGKNLPPLTVDSLVNIKPALVQFLSTGVVAAMDPLRPRNPGEDQRSYIRGDFTKWWANTENNLDFLKLYAHWIAQPIGEPPEGRGIGLGVTILSEVVVGSLVDRIVPEFVEKHIAFSASAIDGLVGSLVYGIEGKVSPVLHEMTLPEIKAAAEAYGIKLTDGKVNPEVATLLEEKILHDMVNLSMAVHMFQAGDITPSNPDDRRIFEAASNGDFSGLAQRIHDYDWLRDQYIKNEDFSLAVILGVKKPGDGS
jgi:hypothetical protein